MVELQNTKDLVIALKHTKEAKNLTIAQLLNIMDERNQSISRTTLNRIFADGSEDNDSFSYTATLKPLAELLLEEDDEQGDDLCSQLMADLRADIRVKNEIIKKMESEVIALKDQIEILQKQLDIENRRMDESNALARRLIDRLDTKDEIIGQFLIDMKQKDELIDSLRDRNVAAEK